MQPTVESKMDAYDDLHNLGVMIRMLDQVEAFTGWDVSSIPEYTEIREEHDGLKASFTQGLSWLAMLLLIEGLFGFSENSIS